MSPSRGAATTTGPYQYPEKIIPLFVTNLLDDQTVPLYGDGLNVRGWVHVDDHCRGVQLVLERGEADRVYHIDGGTELSNRELTAAILRACGASWDMVVTVADRKGHDRRYSLNDSLIRSLGYAPRIDFESGLPATVAWYAANRPWWQPLTRPIPPDPMAGDLPLLLLVTDVVGEAWAAALSSSSGSRPAACARVLVLRGR
jgi:dTDP-glucose 4,6-dehydratase